jgi:hypothetical protein
MAASTVQYKFRTDKKWCVVEFDGQAIGALTLKRAVVQQQRMGRAERRVDFDLLLTNEQTGERYGGDDNTRIPKNTRIIVQRVPATAAVAARICVPAAPAQGPIGPANTQI